MWPDLESLRCAVVEGPRGRQLLITLMADYWLAPDAVAPSGAVVELMNDMGVSASGTRTLLSRLTREGRLQSVKEGRRTFYALSQQALTRLSTGFDAIRRFGVDEAHDPDAPWLILMFSVPEEQRALRQQLRRGLSWMGFSPLYDGVWITPRPVEHQAVALCRKLGVESASIAAGSIEAIGRDHGRPTDAWDLPLAQGLYQAFARHLASPLERLSAGEMTADEALRLRTEIMNIWRGFPKFDPGLPERELPAGWPRAAARTAFAGLYDGAAKPAGDRVREVVARHSPAHLDLVVERLIDPEGPPDRRD
ncbi:hypothetical protein BJF79_29220 [Actinomadura sp. CNU-125]|uniref:PaaX family transcriptional regulator n=1 Tax=Actinomadura sp. CNU-125 TaxID=1904961 RepID=UPI0009628FC2|nr:PaaX family transcriptional regulator C-terminal domain-containing protein [Actinomadura sp. CNU-125]OLT37679.1 hypothetical protein BJF79_29220 [Actinomadura sp. CNU-125]